MLGGQKRKRERWEGPPVSSAPAILFIVLLQPEKGDNSNKRKDQGATCVDSQLLGHSIVTPHHPLSARPSPSSPQAHARHPSPISSFFGYSSFV